MARRESLRVAAPGTAKVKKRGADTTEKVAKRGAATGKVASVAKIPNKKLPNVEQPATPPISISQPTAMLQGEVEAIQARLAKHDPETISPLTFLTEIMLCTEVRMSLRRDTALQLLPYTAARPLPKPTNVNSPADLAAAIRDLTGALDAEA